MIVGSIPFSGRRFFCRETPAKLGLLILPLGSFVLVFVDSSLDIFCVTFLLPQELFQSGRISDVFKVPSTSSPDLVVPHRSGKISSELSYRGILHYVAARYL